MDWLGWFVPRFNRKALPPESMAEPDPLDLAQLEELRDGGSQLTLPHPVRCTLRVITEQEARELAERLTRDGWACQRRAVADHAWTVTAVQRIIPTPGAVTRVREVMTAAALEHGGTFLGWHAPAVL